MTGIAYANEISLVITERMVIRTLCLPTILMAFFSFSYLVTW